MAMEQTKTCASCGQSKPIDAYQLQNGKPRATCRACRSGAIKNYKHDPDRAALIRDRERTRSAARSAYMQAWRAENPDKTVEYNRAKSCPVYFVVCVETGNLFTARNARTRLSPEGRLLAARRKELARATSRHSAAATSCTCTVCGQCFMPTYGDKLRRTCSTDCQRERYRRAHRGTKCHRRRARKYGAPYHRINPLAVFERDGWRCQICGTATPQTKRGSYEPDAPELDHIKPLSRGGAHTLDNVQCACRRCNALKSNAMPMQVAHVAPCTP